MNGAVVVDANGALRRAGPLTVEIREEISTLPRGVAYALPVDIGGLQDAGACTLRWTLLQVKGSARGDGAASCVDPTLSVPRGLPAGSYWLTIEAFAGADSAAYLSDGVTTTVTVTDAADDQPR
jgi:hypothetical protein